jgi:hypothetical protein
MSLTEIQEPGPDPEREPKLADPEALWASISQLFAERRRYRLPDGRSLAGFRRSLHVSQEMLAARLGLKQARVSRFESQSDPRIQALRAYVAGLGGTLVLLARLPGRDVHLLA